MPTKRDEGNIAIIESRALLRLQILHLTSTKEKGEGVGVGSQKKQFETHSERMKI